MRKTITILLFVALLVLGTKNAFAHAAVKPAQVGIGITQTFTVGVPNEREVATTGLRLVVPEGLEHTTPNVKQGWRIATKSQPVTVDMEGEHPPVTEIIWSGGVIPEGQREEFVFSAKVPASETKLVWKFYQTYADGKTVAWELAPGSEQPKDAEGKPDYSSVGPASVTDVVNDLKTDPQPEKAVEKSRDYVAYIALAISAISLGMQFAKKK